MPTIRANDLDIGYDIVGAGPPIVMLHGATSLGREDFAAQVPLFSRAFLLHLPDARGHGRTRWDARDGFRYDWLVDDLVAFTDALGLRTFHLLGFSMGAMTALQFASLHPARVRTLVAIGITTQREPRRSVLRGLLQPAKIEAEDPAWAMRLSRRHDDGQGQGGWRRLLPAIAADVASQPLMSPADLHRIDAPTMIVCGDRDPFVPVDHAWGISRQIPGGRLFVAPECGHEVTVKRPGLFNEALTGFYRATETEAARRAQLAPNDPVAPITPKGDPS
ncbi:MAG: alpha/beta hydrolase [Chloroflexi bacterium]|nr:alpha/beta hydrolase [Chloroflexota bacterium]